MSFVVLHGKKWHRGCRSEANDLFIPFRMRPTFLSAMDLTIEMRNVRWPRNFVETPLPESMPKESKNGCTNQCSKDIREKLEEGTSHVKIQRDEQFHIGATSMRSL